MRSLIPNKYLSMDFLLNGLRSKISRAEGYPSGGTGSASPERWTGGYIKKTAFRRFFRCVFGGFRGQQGAVFHCPAPHSFHFTTKKTGPSRGRSPLTGLFFGGPPELRGAVVAALRHCPFGVGGCLLCVVVLVAAAVRSPSAPGSRLRGFVPVSLLLVAWFARCRLVPVVAVWR